MLALLQLTLISSKMQVPFESTVLHCQPRVCRRDDLGGKLSGALPEKVAPNDGGGHWQVQFQLTRTVEWQSPM